MNLKYPALALALWLCACGDEKTSDTNMSGSGGANTAGTGGEGGVGGDGGAAGTIMATAGVGGGGEGGEAGATAGTNNAGTGAGEMAGAAGFPTGTDEYDLTEHCATGTYVTAYDFRRGAEPTQHTTCSESDYLAAGVPMGPRFPPLLVESARLPTPMQANQPYAVSLEMSYAGLPSDGQVEIWGTQANCGAGSTAELLYSGMPVWKRQILCLDLTPAAAYSHLLLVVRFVGEDLKGSMSLIFDGATFCPTGTCPSE